MCPRGRLLCPSSSPPRHPPQPLTLTLMNMSDPKRLKRLVRLCTFFFVLEEVTCLGPAVLTICEEKVEKRKWWWGRKAWRVSGGPWSLKNPPTVELKVWSKGSKRKGQQVN